MITYGPFSYLLILMLVIINSCTGKTTAPEFSSGKEPPSHKQWDELTKKHVSADGWVDYKGFIKDSTTLNKYLNLLSTTPPDNKWPRNEKMAYWLNTYNAFTVKLIIDNYPVESIKDIGPSIYIPTVRDIFTAEFIPIGDKKLSLNDVEHGALRNMNEPRIHFAVNCASVSCPKLKNEAYTAEKLETQLQDQAEYFLNRSGKNNLAPDQVKVSKIFKWFSEDFTEDGSLIDFLNKFSNVKIKPDASITYLDYNWNLNSVQNKDQVKFSNESKD